MDIDDLQGINFPGPLVNFKTQEYIYLSIGNFIKYKEKFKIGCILPSEFSIQKPIDDDCSL